GRLGPSTHRPRSNSSGCGGGNKVTRRQGVSQETLGHSMAYLASDTLCPSLWRSPYRRIEGEKAGIMPFIRDSEYQDLLEAANGLTPEMRATRGLDDLTSIDQKLIN